MQEYHGFNLPQVFGAFGMGWIAVALPVLLVAAVVVIARLVLKRRGSRA
jgi:hypothetical protein